MTVSLPFRFNSVTKPDGDFMMKLMQDLDAVGAVFAVLGPAVGVTSWTPALTFATPGDLAVTYSTQAGFYIRIGPLVVAKFSIVTSAFTFTTASGFAIITGIPFTATNDATANRSVLEYQGITKAGYTSFTTVPLLNTRTINIICCGSAQTLTTLAAADMPTGGSVILRSNVIYFTSDP